MSVVRVEVAAGPDPFLLRSAIAARLDRHPWPGGPELAVADAVAAAVSGALANPADGAEEAGGGSWP
ncbi:MAG: hypothetical protein ACR2KK_02760 [Acidimicrobiales bacterium]